MSSAVTFNVYRPGGRCAGTAMFPVFALASTFQRSRTDPAPKNTSTAATRRDAAPSARALRRKRSRLGRSGGPPARPYQTSMGTSCEAMFPVFALAQPFQRSRTGPAPKNTSTAATRRDAAPSDRALRRKRHSASAVLPNLNGHLLRGDVVGNVLGRDVQRVPPRRQMRRHRDVPRVRLGRAVPAESHRPRRDADLLIEHSAESGTPPARPYQTSMGTSCEAMLWAMSSAVTFNVYRPGGRCAGTAMFPVFALAAPFQRSRTDRGEMLTYCSSTPPKAALRQRGLTKPQWAPPARQCCGRCPRP